jgi:cation diffusion facilitator CzcD-associated flavoprotein CzcO
VTVFTGSGLERVTAKGIIDPDGNEHEVDVIILATGFNTSWVPRFPIVADGVNLQDLYRDRPIGYLGVAAPRMPNVGPSNSLFLSTVISLDWLSRFS